MASFYVRPGSPYYWVRFQNRTAPGAESPRVSAKLPMVLVERSNRPSRRRRCMSIHFPSKRRAIVSTLGFPLPCSEYPTKTLLRYHRMVRHQHVPFAPRRHCPAQVTYHLCTDYPAFRTHPPKGLLTALAQHGIDRAQVFSAIMQEAVRRGYVAAIPRCDLDCDVIRRSRSPNHRWEQATIEAALATREVGWLTVG